MKKKIVLIICTAIIIPIITFAHSGRTDSAGGHYDSSTGEYHYHHGYPAHQHNPDGSCPYETSSKLNVNEILDTYHDNQISNLENQISIYKAQVQLKQNTIEGLSKEIATNYQSTENLKFVIFLLTSVTIILCYIIHILNKNLKEKEYKLQQIKKENNNILSNSKANKMFYCPNCNTRLIERKKGHEHFQVCPKCNYKRKITVKN